MDFDIVQLPTLAQRHIKNRDIDTIVLHSMAQYLDTEPHDIGAYDFLKAQGLSAHALIDPAGNIIRTASDNDLCYHAKGHNSHSLGVEILVPGLHTYSTFIDTIAQPNWYTDAQYQAAIYLCVQWCLRHALDLDAIKTHATLSPRRKLDPGAGFPFHDFIGDVAEALYKTG
jgi:N-acetyl-anhydromuramyl-L-alanine amidase AmpD